LELVGVSGTTRMPTDDVVVIVIPGTGLLDQLSAEVGVPAKALIGATLLDHYLTTVDYQSAALRFQKYNDADTKGATDWQGPGFQMCADVPCAAKSGDWTIYECYTNKDAYAEGLREGDVVEQIDSTPLTGQSSSTVQRLLDSYHVGDTMHVTYRRGSTVSTAEVLVEDLLPHYLPPS